MSTPPPTTSVRNPLRKRVLGGGVIVGLLAVGWWLSGLFRGAGPGSGTGDEGTSGSQSSSVSTDGGNTDLAGDDRDSPSPGHGDRLTVLISGDAYQIVEGDRKVPATLDEIVDLAGRAPGDDDGIRVRILHDATGISGAQTDLLRALGEAGLTQDQLQVVPQSVE